ncbi:helix-turn-helix transcriptional regulator [Methylobacterium segetis]|uniref:helix-turn-helix transcriptional regulator n=1 Tax=Methylobacterium segetis TaxID=2488750 RepID=UPI00104751B1|nr:helix-turn-helix transcriptional regulator [Methylobacterium segetis]
MPKPSRSSSGNFAAPDARHLRAARTLLDWTQDDLAARAKLVRRTIVAIETDRSKPRNRTLKAIVRAFSDAGVEFECGEDGRVKIVDDIWRRRSREQRCQSASAKGRLASDTQPVSRTKIRRRVNRRDPAFG